MVGAFLIHMSEIFQKSSLDIYRLSIYNQYIYIDNLYISKKQCCNRAGYGYMKEGGKDGT